MAYIILALLLAGAFPALCLVHALVSRAARYCAYGADTPQTVALCTIMASNIPVMYLAWKLVLQSFPLVDMLGGAAYVLLTYNACCFCYFWLLNVTETSLHVNILMRLLAGGGASPQELASRYSVQDMIDARIERMQSLGQLEERDGRYFLSDRTFLYVGSVYDRWRKILGMPLNP